MEKKEKINEIYQNLTGVDIKKQKNIWDDRGKGYYGEYLLFCKLYSDISGCSKILMNIEIPTSENKSTEIDLVMIHETGLYVFEIKHYKGTIYGKDTDKIWTQYFKTVKNSTFNNPIKQNEYHIKALKEMFPDMPMYSFIVFTNEDCDLKVTNNSSSIVCDMDRINNELNHKIYKKKIYSMEDIDSIFDKLSKFSKMQESVTKEDVSLAFSEWLQPFISELKAKTKEAEEYSRNLQDNFKKEEEKLEKAKKKGYIINACIAIACIVLSSTVILGFSQNYKSAIQKNTEELELFKQNFLHVDQIDNEYIDDLQSYISVDSVTLNALTDDAVSFTATLMSLTDTYRIQFQENSKYIAITTDGKVFEYDVFDSTLKFNLMTSIMCNNADKKSVLQEKQFYGINNPQDIEHIKVVNVSVLKNDVSRTVLKEDLQLAIYTKPEAVE